LFFEIRMKNHMVQLNYTLEKYLNDLKLSENELLYSLKYTLLAPCRRLRALMMIAFYELFGGKKEVIYKFAAALEMIQAYSLIHDDLPCMDDGLIRRGKECSHLKFGESTALLAGDALLTQAFEIISSDEILETKNALKCVNVLARCAGAKGMILGQFLDLKFLDHSMSKEEILEMYSLKTGALFIAASKIGSLLAGASDSNVKLAEEYAKNLGICFQIVDDILDKDSSLFRSEDSTMAEEMVAKLVIRCKGILRKFEGDISFLECMTDFIHRRIK